MLESNMVFKYGLTLDEEYPEVEVRCRIDERTMKPHYAVCSSSPYSGEPTVLGRHDRACCALDAALDLVSEKSPEEMVLSSKSSVSRSNHLAVLRNTMRRLCRQHGVSK